MQTKHYTQETFGWVNWDVATIENVAADAVAKKKARYAVIKAIPAAERTFENTIYAIEAAGVEMLEPLEYIYILDECSPDADIRKKAQESIQKAMAEQVDIEYDPEMYRAYREYADQGEKLDGPDLKLFEEMGKDYRRMGFELPEEERTALKQNLKELTDLENQFRININNYEDFILVTEEELDGLSPNFVQQLTRDESGKYKVSLKYPEYTPFICHAKNSLKRKELADKSLQKGGPQNIVLLKRITELRLKNAQLLGYGSHADFVTEKTMAKNHTAVSQFLTGLAQRLKPGLEKDRAALNEYKEKYLGGGPVEYHDPAFIIERLTEEKFKFKEEMTREFFPLHRVLDGIFELAQQLFGAQFSERKDISLWHEDVRLWEVSDHDGLKGYVALDLFPRPGKYSHAGCASIVNGHHVSYHTTEYVTPFCAILANLNKPAGDTPSLLSHTEAKTLFHEFGHVFHNIFTRAPYVSQSGTHVVGDFVEVPSKLMENWWWDADIIRNISGHHSDENKKLPDEIIANMIKARDFFVSYDTTMQIMRSLFDQKIHGDESISDPAGLYADMLNEFVGLTYPKGQIWPAGFGHLMGYDARYYSYIWSQVYAADFFSRFEKEGVLNSATGQSLKKEVLEKGSSIDEMQIVRNFLGREPSNEAFLKQCGIE